MRHIAAHQQGGGITATTLPEPAGVHGHYRPAAMGSRPNEKVDLASLLPGGQTHRDGSERIGSGDTSSPEPVIGYGATKGIREYYRAVLMFGLPADMD